MIVLFPAPVWLLIFVSDKDDVDDFVYLPLSCLLIA